MFAADIIVVLFVAVTVVYIIVDRKRRCIETQHEGLETVSRIKGMDGMSSLRLPLLRDGVWMELHAHTLVMYSI